MLTGKSSKPIPPEVYTRDYYLGGEEDHSLRGGIGELERFIRYGKLLPVFQKALKYASLSKGDIVLDVGCGRGELACHLARNGKLVYGIDYSPIAINVAQRLKKTLPKAAFMRVNFAQVDCTSLPFKDNYFDAIFAIDVVEHLTVQQINQAFGEAYRVLKSGGRLIIHTNNLWFEKIGVWLIAASYHWFGVFRQKSINPEEGTHINYLSKNRLLKDLKRVGFEAKVEMTVPRDLKDVKKYLTYNNFLLQFVVQHLGYFFLKTPLQYFFSPTLWASAIKK